MSIRVVKLGTHRLPDEGLRIGTVRRPPRGIPKTEFASRDYYDVWLPNLSPSVELIAQGKAVASQTDWNRFEQLFRKEMNNGDTAKVLDLLVALSRTTNFSVGCYCDDENRCHRSILRQLLEERGAEMR